MKKTFFLSLVAMGLLMTACIEDNGNHHSEMVNPAGYGLVYADQDLDSIVYLTTERHTVSSNVPWIKPEADFISSISFKDDVLYSITVPVYFDANTTGKQRTGFVTVNAGEYSVGATFIQLPFLCVRRPSRVLASNTMDVLSFGPLADTIYSEVDSISFTAYGDWTLSSGQWATPSQTSGTAGTYTVRLDYEPYESTEEDRADTLFLTSRGVRDFIPILQLKRKPADQD